MRNDLTFDADEFRNLRVNERVHRCRLLAKRAQALADAARPAYRESYADIAQQWLVLADDMERSTSD
jgi:hypothetical protein